MSDKSVFCQSYLTKGRLSAGESTLRCGQILTYVFKWQPLFVILYVALIDLPYCVNLKSLFQLKESVSGNLLLEKGTSQV